jgi:hypothetical protein
MSYAATVFNVLIASPGDIREERRVTREVVHEWNSVHSRSRKVVLLPRGWDKDAYSSMGGRAQAELNKQIVDDADLLIAIFGTRIGTPTGEAEGGSIEELTSHMKTGKPAMVFQSFAPVDPRVVATDQYKKLSDFIDTWAKPKGILWPYHSLEEFRDELRRQLATRVNDDPYFTPVEKPATRESRNPSIFEISERLGRGESLDYVAAVPDLSPEAKTLLIEAAKDEHGNIICRDAVSTGWQVQTNGKAFVEAGVPRSRARWQAAVEELASSQLIQEQNARGLYQLTNQGYEVADRLSR